MPAAATIASSTAKHAVFVDTLCPFGPRKTSEWSEDGSPDRALMSGTWISADMAFVELLIMRVLHCYIQLFDGTVSFVL